MANLSDYVYMSHQGGWIRKSDGAGPFTLDGDSLDPIVWDQYDNGFWHKQDGSGPYTRDIDADTVLAVLPVPGGAGMGEGGGGSTTVVNNLTSTSTTSALSAAQGKALKDTADALATTVAGKAALDSPALTGTPSAPTATTGTSTTQLATTAFVHAVVDAVVEAAPGTLDTLNELAAALGDDANFATTMTNALAAKAPLDSPSFTTPDLGTPSAGTLTNATGLPLTTGVTGTLGFANGGTGLAALGTGLQVLRVNAGGTALEFGTPAGTGDVTKVGTPADGQVGVWTGDGTIEGDAAFAFNTTDNSLLIGAGSLTRAGAHVATITTTGTTDVTLPTAGTLSTLAGAESLSSKTLVAPVISGISTSDGANVTTAATITITANAGTIDVTKGLSTATNNADTTLSVSGAPATANTWFGVHFINSDAVPHTLTFPSAFSQVTQAARTTCPVAASGQLYLLFRYDGSAYKVFGDAGFLNNYTATVAPAVTDDLDLGYGTGSLWLDATGNATYICESAANGAAVWHLLGGAGDVVKVGTPANNQMAVWTGDGTLEGTADFTYDGTNLNLATAKNFQIAGGTVLADAAGTLTLSGIDALDATTEATIEAALDTLANLTSIQGLTVTLADAGADALLGWDDSAGAYQNLSAADARTALALVGKLLVPVMAPGISPSATGGCATLATIASAANQPDIQTLDFDATTQEYAQFSIAMPESWDEGTVTFAPIWSHAATTTDFGVVWDLQAVAVSNDDTIAQAFGTAVTSTDTGGTTNDVYVGPESAAITIAGTPAAGDTVFFRLSRVTGDAGDTMAIDARLHGIRLYYTSNAAIDA